MAHNEMRPPALDTRNGLGERLATTLGSSENNATGSLRQVQRAAKHAAVTPEHILALAAMPGGFRVSWHRRDEWILHRCAKLVRAGKLRRIRKCAKGAYFYGLTAVEAAP